MNLIYIGLLFITAYLLGSIPTAVWLGKAVYGIDVREHGSGNAGATNTFRVLGKKAAIPVMLIDIAKAYLACSLIRLLPGAVPNSSSFLYLQIGLGIVAVVGHIYPVFAGFRGGKGIASLFGMILAIHTPTALICLLIFVLILLTTHYVSLGSMLAALAYPFLVFFIFTRVNSSLVFFGILVCFLVFYTHRKNITRLLAGTESKIYLFK